MSAFVSAILLVSQFGAEVVAQFLHCFAVNGVCVIVSKGAGCFLQNQAYCDAF
jgi:hypothetical protein